MLKIDVYVMVHNEAVLLPYFLRHYGQFADRIIAFEDQSTDGSREILNAHPRVTVIEPEEHGLAEGYWITKLWPMYEIYSRGRADWVMQVDCDEFVYHPQLMWVLEKMKDEGEKVLFCRGYTMISEGLPTTDGQIYDEIKMGIYDKLSCKSVIFNPEMKIRYRGGRHKIVEKVPSIKSRYHTGLRLLHYRYLGPQYFEERNKTNHDRWCDIAGIDRPYSPDERHGCPDGSMSPRLWWYLQNKDKAEQVVR